MHASGFAAQRQRGAVMRTRRCPPQPASSLARRLPLSPRQKRQCSFFEHRAYKIVYRRYASLFFMVGVDSEEVSAGSEFGQAVSSRAKQQAHTATTRRSSLPNSHMHEHTHPTPRRPLPPQNELEMLEFIHCFVEVLDKHFGQVCELDIMADPDVVSRCDLTVIWR